MGFGAGGMALGDFGTVGGTGPGPLGAARAGVTGEITDFRDTEVDDAERGVGWLSSPGEAGLEVDEKGSVDGALGAL